MDRPVVGIVMGSSSDLPTMQGAIDAFKQLEIGFEVKVYSAHRTPDRLDAYLSTAVERGIKVLIAGAGGAAHLPGVVAAKTLLPVLGVPVMTESLGGLDSLLSIVQMPGGIPVGTLGIGKSGATNAALLAAAILGVEDPAIRERIGAYRARKADAIVSDIEV